MSKSERREELLHALSSLPRTLPAARAACLAHLTSLPPLLPPAPRRALCAAHSCLLPLAHHARALPACLTTHRGVISLAYGAAISAYRRRRNGGENGMAAAAWLAAAAAAKQPQRQQKKWRHREADGEEKEAGSRSYMRGSSKHSRAKHCDNDNGGGVAYSRKQRNVASAAPIINIENAKKKRETAAAAAAPANNESEKASSAKSDIRRETV